MKFFDTKKALNFTAVIILIIPMIIHLTDFNHIYKAVWYNFVDIDDYKIFQNRVISKSSSVQPWKYSVDFNKKKLSPTTQHLLDSLKSLD